MQDVVTGGLEQPGGRHQTSHVRAHERHTLFFNI
jgi:hypothetical protein